ncbi:Alpha/Beta hydrolase protein [Mycena pura]|uniref:Alpha/Beta hydrolase protein n=1 Tax=Mycena pura TaxID=153505 RepID=A0AAD6YKX1_9AGAR|nr:Alpha/Beta hydrolase protein [Mycena pura]
MALPNKSNYGKLSAAQTLGLVAGIISLPVYLLWNVATTAYASHNSKRTLKRIITDSALRHVTSTLSNAQLQSAFGTDLTVYEQWTKNNKQPKTIDELGDDAKLLWIGPKRLDRGAFLLPCAEFMVSFWRYVQLELEKQNIEVGFALLSYSLAPYAVFPTPLKQARLALDFLFAAGVKPQNLQLVGDSAGGNMVLQVLSQVMHPLASVPEIRLPGPLRGAFLISPWVSLSATSKSHTENDGRDILTHRTLNAWGAEILKDTPPSDNAFVEAVRAPEDWFAGVDLLVDRVLISGGGAECLRDDIVAFGEAFKKHHKETELVVQKDGLHEDMYLDFALGEKKLSSLTPLTVEWLAAGFLAEPST